MQIAIAICYHLTYTKFYSLDQQKVIITTKSKNTKLKHTIIQQSGR